MCEQGSFREIAQIKDKIEENSDNSHPHGHNSRNWMKYQKDKFGIQPCPMHMLLKTIELKGLYGRGVILILTLSIEDNA